MFQKLIERLAYKPRTEQVFWCKICDHKQVDSTNFMTGRFFVAYGHLFNKKTREYDGDYRGLMFAVCTDCLAE